MKKRNFVISSFLVAGIAPLQASEDSNPDLGGKGSEPDPDAEAVKKFALDHRFVLAQHRSHSSHASHGSHRSGSSGRVRMPAPSPPPPPPPRTYPAPAPAPAPVPSRNEQSTPPSSILPSSPAIAPNPLFTPPSGEQIKAVVKKVQIGLLARGYYQGAIDGLLGPGTRKALRQLQTARAIQVTGTITPEVLDELRIVAE